ncbi:Probable tubulin polyglutamylase ttll-15 [Geodia barretti]|nr:Probable tubulin polyglutamylase ttll-15 [Geodia barretti]
MGTESSHKSPTLWIYHDKDRPLHHVMTVFSRAGYALDGGPGGDWHILWSHKYPFKTLSPSLGASLRPHQRINHYPGTGCFVSKPSLASLPFSYIPKAFRLPQQAQQLREEAAAHPEKLWVQKNNLHRGIKVKPIDKVSFAVDGKFVQEFITNPLLLGGRKFDIGVYTAITSIDPLRVYIYHEELLLRFCSKDYRPFRASDPKQYVVDDEYTPVWEIPSLADLYQNQKLSCKQTLNTALQTLGHDPRRVWDQVNSITTEVLHHCHPNLIKQTKKFSSSPRHFFELVRFDFIIDDQLKVWLMEVNLSPNLSSGHTLGNRFMYEQVLFNLLSLVGAVRRGGPDMQYNGEHESVVLVSDRDTQLPLPQCWNGSCSSCSAAPPATFCQLCPSCQTPELSLVLKEAFLEHVESRNFHRLIPALSLQTPPTATPTDRLMHAWFAGKCKDNARWCN